MPEFSLPSLSSSCCTLFDGRPAGSLWHPLQRLSARSVVIFRATMYGGFCKAQTLSVGVSAAARHAVPLAAAGSLPGVAEYLANRLPFRALSMPFVARSDKLPMFVGKSPFQRVATPLGFEPRITPPKGAVLPLHHGVSPRETLDWPF